MLEEDVHHAGPDVDDDQRSAVTFENLVQFEFDAEATRERGPADGFHIPLDHFDSVSRNQPVFTDARLPEWLGYRRPFEMSIIPRVLGGCGQ